MDVEFYFGRRHVPAFGSWDYNYDLPFTQCFESATQTRVLHYNNYPKPEEHDLYSNTPSMIVVPRNRGKGRYAKEKQEWICDCEVKPGREATPKPKAVDEDLYKISPHLLRQHIKRKRGLGAIFSSCLRPTCVC